MQKKGANRLAHTNEDAIVCRMLVFGFTPRSSGASVWDYPETSCIRLPPSHGMTVSARSNPAATSNGL